jgi:regulator of protease activity HflC (stomatin/prohibitin superfamily)
MADQPQVQSQDQQYAAPPVTSYSQLTTARVPLSEAQAAFESKDANGRTPIVVLSERKGRINTSYLIMAAIVLVLGWLLGIWQNNTWVIGLATIVALAIVGIAIYRSFYVTIPEGTNALLAQRGKYLRTSGPGLYVLSPFVSVTHLVTKREIPFEVPVAEAPTRDNVRASADVMVTFTIADPFRFVYGVSAEDFDRVFQAACQSELRTMIRNMSLSQVNDLTGADTSQVLASLNAKVEPYGVAVQKVNITYARPPVEFLASQEGRELAALRQVEQAEIQALAQRRQADQEVLAQQAMIAQVEREREALKVSVQAAEIRKHIVELEAEAERLRLAKLEERLRDFPEAVRWDVESAQLDIARGLASNTRAIVQVGTASEISRVLAMGDSFKEATTQQAAGTNNTGEVGSDLTKGPDLAKEGQRRSTTS